jgi:hypothetical protein
MFDLIYRFDPSNAKTQLGLKHGCRGAGDAGCVTEKGDRQMPPPPPADVPVLIVVALPVMPAEAAPVVTEAPAACLRRGANCRLSV